MTGKGRPSSPAGPLQPALHTVGAFAIIFDKALRLLLCHRTDVDMWNLPGGRVESDESPWTAVVREVSEETGLLVRVDRLLGVYSIASRTDLVFNFLCIPTGGAIRLSDEADDIRWFGRAEIPSNTLARHADRIEDAFASQAGICLKSQG